MENQFPEIPEYIKQLISSGTAIDEILIDKEGVWYHNGEKFTNEKILNFFERSLNITADGEYVISYGDYTYPVKVEDTPFFITGVIITGFGDFEKILLNLSTGETEELNCNTLYCKKNNALYCRVKHGRMTAKFKRSPSFELLERLEDSDDGKYYLRLCGQRIELHIED